MATNLTRHKYSVSKKIRNQNIGHNSFLVWFTGLSGSGKSTVANALEKALFKSSIKTYSLDGDNIRKGLNADLGFSEEDRTENIRRIAEVAKLFVDAGIVTIAAFVSPYKKDRENIKTIVGNVNFVEVFVSTSLQECERRDVKGLYQKARAGEIKNMTGISAPYQRPENPDVDIDTEQLSVEQCVDRILNVIEKKLKLYNE